ncbi:MAG TPA: hypothetical protein VG387_16600 [Rhizomicrobium sp.]|jgi:hypothetical protein|nr:hypothetical protein [Rhizomicrobium sp.]
MYRTISAVVAILWGAFVALGALAAIATHPTNAPDSLRVFVGIVAGVIPLIAGIVALVRRWALPLIVGWGLVVAWFAWDFLLSVLRHKVLSFTVAMLIVSVVAVILSILARREDRPAAGAAGD